ncbi:MAG: nuclear transport factor 2 family protein [Acidobacteria bacterium]|nr:nuclear transport factor 2 family protein [Acidobacteriota bacterium]
MLKKSFFIVAAVLSLSAVGLAQDTNSGTTQINPAARRSRTTTTKPAATTATPSTPASGQQGATAPAASPVKRAGTARGGVESAASRAVRDAFDTLINGIRRGDVGEVMGVYWNSPRLVLFNNNGTVTKSWEQVRSNRQSLYAKVKDIKLDISDDRVLMTGRDAALVTARWKQSQTYEGKPESSSGRMTVVFQNVGGQWKAVHAHTSPDRPDPSLLMPSERTAEPNDAANPPVKP